ncbi:NADH dehydrogenase [ubiquinone] 1 alpha subcomplex assembly factor 4-like [Stylophora pistillata]|uniref:NADH dehydrogenase [ubiquinone] 1 alpha subcomplex assembly factor 4 n=1 Tax=Stylophora pistillata TaxID=50429 RepID=A0A2B4SMT5_STYPI|nr:NADH dehydrogenase [ubiquinone] 1 alpha subcomplex assembly factor 4-like [Stylophora pistillata]PFX31211.1 NADH dehydrogenase [ubiquinone] 1 alpha subcomplex assembly factor 4 [Stylophora pistillata]
MGAGISRATRLIRKPLETHRRVEKILEKKPKPAPKHPSSESAIADARNHNKELFKQRDRKDDILLGRLKDFKIMDAQEGKPITGEQETNRKLPVSRESMSRQVGVVPKGKITSVQLSELFAKRLEDPDKWTDEKLAEHYKLDKEALSSVLKYCSDYTVVARAELPRPLEPSVIG